MRCNEELFNLVTQDKIQENDEFELYLTRDLPDCKRISALKPVAVSGDSKPNQYRRPVNRFECMREGCVNTGLLMMTAADETATYHAAFDATEFAGGVVTFYVYPDETATFPMTVTFKIGNEQALTNANVYTQTITEDMVGEDGFAPVVVLLADAPDSTEGDGWTPSPTGAYIQLSADKVAGYSSIAIIDALNDFELNDVILMRCVQNAGDDISLNTIEEACTEAQYDKNINSLPFSMSATKISSNYMKGNPLYGKGDSTTGFVPMTTKKTIESYTFEGEEYGRVILADANQDECGRIAMQIVDECATDMLSELSIPRIVDIDEGHFLVIKNDDGTTDLIVNKEHIGREVRISYPALRDAEMAVYSTDFLGDTKARLVHRKKIGGVEYTIVYDNVLITTFPVSISTDSAVFNWSFAIIRDKNGYFKKEYKINA